MTHAHYTKPTARPRDRLPTAKTRSGSPRRPAYDTVGLLTIDDAAEGYAAWWGCPEHGDVLKPLLQEGVSSAKNRLQTVQVDGMALTSLRWVRSFVCVARLAAQGVPWPSSPDAPDAGPDSSESEDDYVTYEPPEPRLFDIATPHALDGNDDLEASSEAMVDSEDWASDDDDAMVVGGVLGEFSYTITGPPPASARSDVPAGVSIAEFLGWLEEHHPGLYWLMEDLLLDECTPAELARQAGVSESTISRYRATAPKLYEAAHGSWMDRHNRATSAAASVPRQPRDGRHARGEASRAQIVDVIRFLTWTLQKPPTQRDILAHVGKTSKHHLCRHLTILIQQGTVRLHASGRGYVLAECSDVAPHLSAKTAQ